LYQERLTQGQQRRVNFGQGRWAVFFHIDGLT
jgi:hypothetical protein